MANGFIVINEKNWANMTQQEQSQATYNTLKSIDERLKKLERRPITDKCLAVGSGLIGGFLAAIGMQWSK